MPELLNQLQIQIAKPADVSFVISLHRRLTDYLGFIPTDGIREHIDYGHLRIASCPELFGDQPCGYLLTGATKPVTRVFQLAVAPCKWRQHIGTALLRSFVIDNARRSYLRLLLHCRDGIPANTFWSSLGFNLRYVQLGGERRRKIVNVFDMEARQLFQSARPTCGHVPATRR